jgi:hypothetical protein
MKEKRSKLRRIEIYVEPTVADALMVAAKRDRRTLSNYIAGVLDVYVDEYLAKRGKAGS